MKWEDHSVAELRTVARAYKKHISIGAPSKMSKKELIAVLDKHLLIEEGTNKIKIRAEEQKPLMGKSLAKSKGERLYKTTLKKAQKKKRGELASAQQKDEAQIQSAVAEQRAASPTLSMTLEEEARADELEAIRKMAILERDKPKRIAAARMKQVEQGAKIQLLSAFFDAEQIKLDAEIMMAEMKTNALKAEREKIIEEKTFMQGRGAAADAMAIRPPMMEKSKITTELEQMRDDIISGEADKRNLTRSSRILMEEDKLNMMSYKDEYKKRTKDEEAMRLILLDLIKNTQKQREINAQAPSVRRIIKEGLFTMNTKKENEDILRKEKEINYEKSYKQSSDKIMASNLLQENILPSDLNKMILKEVSKTSKRSKKWNQYYDAGTYYDGDIKNITEIINTTLNRYFTAKHKHFKETGDLSVYLNNQKSMLLESGMLPDSIATELNAKFSDIDTLLEQTTSYSDWDRTYKNPLSVYDKNKSIRRLNKEVLAPFKNLKKIKLLKEPNADAMAIRPPMMEETAQMPIKTYNERVIKVLTNYFDTTTQEKQITKFINENIKTEDDLLKWLKIFVSSIGNKDSIASWRINDDVFGGKNTPEAIKFQKYKFNKTSEGEDDNEWNVKEKVWRLFREKIASKKQKRSNTYDPNA